MTHVESSGPQTILRYISMLQINEMTPHKNLRLPISSITNAVSCVAMNITLAVIMRVMKHNQRLILFMICFSFQITTNPHCLSNSDLLYSRKHVILKTLLPSGQPSPRLRPGRHFYFICFIFKDIYLWKFETLRSSPTWTTGKQL